MHKATPEECTDNEFPLVGSAVEARAMELQAGRAAAQVQVPRDISMSEKQIGVKRGSHQEGFGALPFTLQELNRVVIECNFMKASLTLSLLLPSCIYFHPFAVSSVS